MRLPPFLRFLEPKVKKPDGFALKGHLLVERRTGDGVVELVHESPNFIVDVGLEAVADVLIGPNGGGFSGSIFRMAAGDGGTLPGQLLTPKLPDASWPARTQLFNEVVRQDVSAFSKPTATSMRFVTNFSSLPVPESAYGLADRVINEAALIIGDGVLGGPIEYAGAGVDPGEFMLSTRTFKSASFDTDEDVTISITWTITVARS